MEIMSQRHFGSIKEGSPISPPPSFLLEEDDNNSFSSYNASSSHKHQLTKPFLKKYNKSYPKTVILSNTKFLKFNEDENNKQKQVNLTKKVDSLTFDSKTSIKSNQIPLEKNSDNIKYDNYLRINLIKSKTLNVKSFHNIHNIELSKKPNNNYIVEKNLNTKRILLKNLHHQKTLQLEFEETVKEANKPKLSKCMSYSTIFTLYIHNNTLFNLLSFFSSNEITSFYNVSKQFRMLLNLSIRDAFCNIIHHRLKRNNKNFEILKSSINYTPLPFNHSIKIDIEFTIRIISSIPKNITIIYLHKYFSNSSEKLLDFYSFDISSSESFSIYMTRELSSFNLNTLEKISIQPILQLKKFDMGKINIEVFSSEKCFVNPKEMKIKKKENYIDQKNFNNPRICEFEELCAHWKKISLFPKEKIIMKKLYSIFEPYFNILNVQYNDVGFFIFRVILKAEKTGKVENKEDLGINLVIREKEEVVLNEIKKNALFFEKSNILELRVGDVIKFYLTNNK